MRRLSLLAAFALVSACGPTAPALPEVSRPVDYADPRFGTGGWGYTHGAAFVGATVPHGLVKVGPDTSGKNGTINFLHYSGYWSGDDTVQGFSHLHLHGTGACDYGVLSVMPTDTLDAAHATVDGYASPFKKSTEAVSPGAYAVTLTRGAIRAELTASTRVAHHRYTFAPGATSGVLVLDLSHHLCGGAVPDAQVTLSPADGRFEGRLHSDGAMSKGFGGVDVFFAARVKRPWRAQKVFSAASPFGDGTTATGAGAGAMLEFDVSDGQPVELQLAVSLVSIEGARRNLDAEAPAFDFDATKAAAAEAWNTRLKVVTLAGGGEDERRVFYSALHHVFMMPTVSQDVDGSYRGHDRQVHAAAGFDYLADLSLWDTYRTEHPLLHLLAPTTGRDAVRSLLLMAQQGGAFPKWPLATGDTGSMIGASAEVVLADAWLRGVTDFDAEGAYQLLRAAALDATPPAGGRGGRGQVEAYERLGYVPATGDGSVSVTTEYATDDFALANLAEALGHADDAAHLRARMVGYRKLYDPASGFLRARTEAGALAHPTGFDPLVLSDEYVEANAWHSVWAAPHDVEGLMTLLGGPDAFTTKLTEFFSKSQDELASLPTDSVLRNMPRPYAWAGNEPDIHTAYLFAQAGRPDLTQQWSRWWADTFFKPGPDGLPGNDDGGAMSSWYVFTALGLYPLPGSDRFIVGAPRFPKATLHLAGGDLVVEAPDASPERPYVKAVTLNGTALTAPELRMADLVGGKRLVFTLSATPTTWGQR